MADRSRFVYQNNKTREISFPLGGIGTGSIGLSGSGRLVDWEIFNRPNKGSVNGFSHFSVKVEREDQVVDARILHGDLHPPYSGSINGPQYNSFGFGPNREYLTGLPHFRSVTFTGEYPLAVLDFVDDSFPGQVTLTAFNPFIPLNAFDSSIPAAFFSFEIRNTAAVPQTYTLAGTLSNPLLGDQVHTLYEEEGQRGGRPVDRAYLHLRGSVPVTELPSGDLTLAVEGDGGADGEGDGGLSAQAFWFRGAWFDNLEVYWRELTQPGGLKPREYPAGQTGMNNSGSLASRVTLAPGQSARVRFIIAWNFPLVTNDWNEPARAAAAEKGIPTVWKNYYATQFENSFSSAQYALENWERLYSQTRLFHDALFSSDLDPAVIDAISANLAVIKTATVKRLEDGTFYGFEGCHPTAGCCEGSCTHVWNYTQAVPFLFPELERSMREADFTLNQRADGAMRFRLPLPAGLTAEDFWNFHPCADGQFGNVLKAYAHWKITGDSAWLARFWPWIKKAVEFAWSPTNEYRWDPEKTGVLTGRMHHTLDMELFGPDAWLNGFYLAALKAGAEMADYLGEPETAREYRGLFEKGKAWVDANLFNGEYYHQIVDLRDRESVARFGVEDVYWNAEHGEMKYQIGAGCEIDQLLAQWHANLYGLGEIFDPDQARTALRSLFKYNFKRSMRDYYNPCRIFALNDEAGLVMCEWPAGAAKPMIPIPYSQEVMTGFEYSAASLMIQSGLVEEGLEVVRAVRDRYDGEKRNPWNEIECGSNYARTMSSYALLLAFSGFQFDLTRGSLGFNPLAGSGAGFQSFWSLAPAWGMYRQRPDAVELEVLYGTLDLRELVLPFLPAAGSPAAGSAATGSAAAAGSDPTVSAGSSTNAVPAAVRVTLGGRPISFRQSGPSLTFDPPVKVRPGEVLVVHRS